MQFCAVVVEEADSVCDSGAVEGCCIVSGGAYKFDGRLPTFESIGVVIVCLACRCFSCVFGHFAVSHFGVLQFCAVVVEKADGVCDSGAVVVCYIVCRFCYCCYFRVPTFEGVGVVLCRFACQSLAFVFRHFVVLHSLLLQHGAVVVKEADKVETRVASIVVAVERVGLYNAVRICCCQFGAQLAVGCVILFFAAGFIYPLLVKPLIFIGECLLSFRVELIQVAGVVAPFALAETL